MVALCSESLILALYRRVSLYGESFERTLLHIFVAMLLVFPAFYLLFGFQNAVNATGTLVNYDVAWAWDFPPKETMLKALVVSIRAFTFQRSMPYTLTRESELISSLESSMSAALLALFLLALKRRFKR